MFVFTHPHQNHGSTVLYILELLDALVGNPNEQSITVVQSGGDKGVDEFFCIMYGE